MSDKSTKDIIDTLEQLDEEIEIYQAINGDDDEGVMPLRRAETVIRRLAREAGYEHPKLNGGQS